MIIVVERILWRRKFILKRQFQKFNFSYILNIIIIISSWFYWNCLQETKYFRVLKPKLCILPNNYFVVFLSISLTKYLLSDTQCRPREKINWRVMPKKPQSWVDNKVEAYSVMKKIAKYMAKLVIMLLIIFIRLTNNFTARLIRVYFIKPEALSLCSPFLGWSYNWLPKFIPLQISCLTPRK